MALPGELDPAVQDALVAGPPEPIDGNQVAKVDRDPTDPAWSVVTYADGRTENRPTAEADALPKLPEMGPPPPPAGPGVQPLGFELPPGMGDQMGIDEATALGNTTQAGAGVAPTPSGARPPLEVAPLNRGALPAAQVDPGATQLEHGADATGGPPGKTTVTVSEQTTGGDPNAVADVANAQADILDEQARGQQAAASAENFELARQNEAREAQVREQLRKAEIYTEEAAKTVKAIEDTPIEQDMFKDAPGREVSAWIALALSGFLQGATKGANPALNQMMQSMDRAYDRFIQNQKENKASALNRRAKLLGDAQTAEASLRLQLGKLTEDRARLQAKQAGLDELPPAISAYSANLRVKAAEAGEQVKAHNVRRTETRFEQERTNTPQFQGDRELAALGVDAKAHRDAMDSRGGNLGGVVAGARRLAAIDRELQEIAKRHGGELPHQNLISYDTLGASKLAARAGSDSGKDQVRARQLLEEAKLAFKQTINIKSIDSENEGKNFNQIMDTGTGAETLSAIRDRVNEANQRAIDTAAGYSRNPQGYLNFITRTTQSNPGVTGSRPAPGAEGGPRPKFSHGGSAPAQPTGEAPAPRPLPEPSPHSEPAPPPPTTSRRGTYQRLRG